VLVLPGHRSRRDPAEKAVAHHEIHADTQLLDERIEPAEVVAVVSVAHDDVAAASVLRAVIQSGPVATLGHMNDSSALALRDLWRTVRGSVVRHDHFGSKPKTGNAAASLLNAPANRECLVETGHEHGQLDWLRSRVWGCGCGIKETGGNAILNGQAGLYLADDAVTA
jgi:hypothetical protein